MIQHLLSISFFLICFTFNSKLLYSQSNSYRAKIHEEFKTNKREIPEEFVAKNEHGYFFLYSRGKFGQGESKLVKFDKDLLPTEYEINLTQPPTLGVSEESMGVIPIGDKMVNIVKQTNESGIIFSKQVVDFKSFELQNKELIVNLKDEGIEDSYSSFLLAEDKSSIGLFYAIPERKSKLNTFTFIEFDERLELIRNFTYTLPSDDFHIHDLKYLGKEGLIMILANHADLPPNDLRKDNDIDFGYHIYSLNNGEVSLITKLDNKNKWINNLSILTTQDEINVVGLYSDEYRYDSQGHFIFSMKRDDYSQNQQSFHKYHDEVWQHYQSANYLYKPLRKRIEKNGEIPYFVVKELLPYDDGSYLIVAEQTHTMSNNFSITFFFQDLLVTYVDEHGQPKWSNVIKKDNSKIDTWIYSSFIGVQKPDGSYFLLYNGDKRNLDKDLEKRYFGNAVQQKKSLVVVDINKENGQLTKQEILTKEELGNYQVRPFLTVEDGDERLILFTQDVSNVKKQRFILIYQK